MSDQLFLRLCIVNGSFMYIAAFSVVVYEYMLNLYFSFVRPSDISIVRRDGHKAPHIKIYVQWNLEMQWCFLIYSVVDYLCRN